MINYSTDTQLIDSLDLNGFFIGWPNPPSIEIFKRILIGSYKIVLAYENDKLLGFINSVSDGVLTAYIPLLEVLPEYQGKGIGKNLVLRMQDELKHLYMIDLLCDEELIPYYEKIGMIRTQGVYLRNYDRQSGQ
ncbi:GNAT family N-acetyltransferase [Halobacteriovorax sp. HLS]|uniref:GNAT family N-acetyltransferase n=1 Tax=Halobacteriovorax sp. HLS TaxID=2234000 RepID=UPI000FDC8289|nr:GNAT family N-acetyltransferase [Halobacteriovorax sp. HLS]